MDPVIVVAVNLGVYYPAGGMGAVVDALAEPGSGATTRRRERPSGRPTRSARRGFRPSNRSGTVDGLYFPGAYTTPGIGVPMSLTGGEHAANALQEARGER